jgi:hypothetical protein
MNGPQVLWLGLMVWMDGQPRSLLFVAGFCTCSVLVGALPALASIVARLRTVHLPHPHVHPFAPLPPGHPFARPTPQPTPTHAPAPTPQTLEILVNQLAGLLTAVEALKTVIANGSTIVADLKSAEPAIQGVIKDIEAMASELSAAFASIKPSTPAASPSSSVPGGA